MRIACWNHLVAGAVMLAAASALAAPQPDDGRTPEELLIESLARPAEPDDPRTQAALSTIENMVRSGYPGDVQKGWWSRNGDPFVSAVSQQTGLSGNVVTLVLGGNTKGEGVLQALAESLEHYGNACAAYEIGKCLCQGRGDLAALAGAKVFLSKQLGKTAGGAMSAAGVGFLDYALNAMGKLAVETTDMRWWKAYVNFQTQNHDSDAWTRLFLDGGYDAVAAECDRFWQETEEVRGEAFLKANYAAEGMDPRIAYRNRFLKSHVFPWVQGHLAAQKTIARKNAVLATMELDAALARATVRLRFRVHNVLAQFCDDGSVVRFKVTAENSGKVLAKTEVEPGKDQGVPVEFALDLKDMKDGTVTVDVAAVGTVSGGAPAQTSYFVTLGRGTKGQVPPRVAVRDTMILVDLPPFLMGAVIRKEKGQIASGASVPVPDMPRDSTAEYEKKLNQAWVAYQDRQITFPQAHQDIESLRAQAAAAQAAYSGDCAHIRACLEHNRDLEMAQLRRTGQDAQAEAVRKSYEPRIQKVVDADAAVAVAAQQQQDAWHTKLQNERKRIEDHDAAILKRLEEIRKESEAADQEALAAERELDALLDDCSHLERATHIYGMGVVGQNEVIVDEQTVAKMEAVYQATQEKLGIALQRYQAARDRCVAVLARLADLHAAESDFITWSQGIDPAAYDQYWSESLSTQWIEQKVERVRLKQEAIEKIDVAARLRRNATAIGHYVARRRARQGDTGALLAQIEREAGRLPDARQVQEAISQFEQIMVHTRPCLQAYQSACLHGLSTVEGIPAPALDQGTDQAFLEDAASRLDGLVAAHPAVVSDMLAGPEQKDNAFSNLRRTLPNLRWQDLSSEQTSRIQALLQNWSKLEQVRLGSDLWEIGDVRLALQALLAQGRNPAERLRGIQTINREIAQRIEQDLAKVRAGAAVSESTPRQVLDARLEECLAVYRDAGRAYGRPGGFLSLDNERRRGELYQAIWQCQVLQQARTAQGRPDAPAAVQINGRDVPLDGQLVVLTYDQLSAIRPELAETYRTGGRAVDRMIVIKPLKSAHTIEMSGLRDEGYYPLDERVGMEWPVIMNGRSCRMELFIRHSTPKKVVSRFGDEPPLTILVLRGG